jgi:aminoglycoside/choline kinase family phosphotransferase
MLYNTFMNDMKEYLSEQLETKKIGFERIQKIPGEASTRAFYRVLLEQDSLVAMVYPEDAEQEIERITRLTRVYKTHQLKVPEIKDRIGNRILLLQDLGDILLQKPFSQLRKTDDQRLKFLEETADILIRLHHIPPGETAAVLDTARMKWELDFFFTHFGGNYLPAAKAPGIAPDFQNRLHRLADSIKPIDTFAHRDFHSRNMLVHNGHIYLVDFQDSLVAPPYYDLVSFAFDAYLDLAGQREFLMERLQAKGMQTDEEQYYLTALQRNIKALGTFGFQVHQRHNLSYKKYIPRTLRHVLSNKLFNRFFTPAHFAMR